MFKNKLDINYLYFGTKEEYTMRRLIPITFIAGATTFGLFAFMSYLIASDETRLAEGPVYQPIEVYQTPKDSKVIEKAKPKLTPPPPPTPAPPPQVAMVSPVSKAVFDYQPPTLDLASNTLLNTINAPRDTDARPVVRVNPKYPIAAANNGTEGYVVLSFNINEIGQVTNVNVIEAEPKRVFNKAAKQALKKWKYRAKMLNGKAIAQEHLTVRLDFNMNQQS